MTLSAFLTEAGLGVYVSTLAAQGYDDLQTVRGLDASDATAAARGAPGTNLCDAEGRAQDRAPKV